MDDEGASPERRVARGFGAAVAEVFSSIFLPDPRRTAGDLYSMFLDMSALSVFRQAPRVGPGKRTLYTIWKKVDKKGGWSMWPEPLTRQCRRQLDRQALYAARSEARRMRRRHVEKELKASRAMGVNLPHYRYLSRLQGAEA